MTAGTLHPCREALAAPRLVGVGAALLLPFVAVVGVAAASGGFNATSFGWTALAFAWVVIIASRSRRRVGSLRRRLARGRRCGLPSTPSPRQRGQARSAAAFDNGHRSLDYLSGIAAALLVLRRGRTQPLARRACARRGRRLRLLAGDAAVPGSLRCGFNADSGYRLFVPIGYWNALGIFAAIAAAARPRSRDLSAAVACSGCSRLSRSSRSPPTLYFTFSRGAWLALAVGLLADVRAQPACGFGCSPARSHSVPIPAVGVLLASGASGAHAPGDRSERCCARWPRGSRSDSRCSRRRRQSLRSAYVVWRLAARRSRRLGAPGVRSSRPRRRARRVDRRVRHVTARRPRSPVTPTTRSSRRPRAAPISNGRLFTLSNHGRTVLWRAALDDFLAHPVVGSGAGSFGRWWLAHRTTFYFVEEAHNLYLQTLAEVGVVGFALLVALLGVTARSPPFVLAGIRSSRRPSAPTSRFSCTPPSTGTGRCPLSRCSPSSPAAVPVAATRGSEPRAASGRCRRAWVGRRRSAHRGRLLRRADREHRSRTRAVAGSSTVAGARRSATRPRRIGGPRGRRRPCARSARADRLLERARHLRGDRSADRVRRCGRRARARASSPHGDRARPAHRDPVLHLQPRRDVGARVSACSPSSRSARSAFACCRRPARPCADPGCRRAARLPGLRADAPVGRRERGRARGAPARARARAARGRAGRRRGGLRRLVVAG